MQCDIRDGMMVSEDVIGGHIISKRGGGRGHNSWSESAPGVLATGASANTTSRASCPTRRKETSTQNFNFQIPFLQNFCANVASESGSQLGHGFGREEYKKTLFNGCENKQRPDRTGLAVPARRSAYCLFHASWRSPMITKKSSG